MTERSRPHIRNEDRTSTTTKSSGDRHPLVACLIVIMVYATFASAGLSIRWELHRWGFTLEPWQRSALAAALLFHIALAAGAGCLAGMAGRRKHVTKGWSRAALASLCPLLLASTDLIAAVGFQPIRRRTEVIMPHATRYWTLRPGYVDTYRDVTYRINDHGFRGPLVPYQKRVGEYRLLFLGDSIAFGQGVQDEDGFVRRTLAIAVNSGGYADISVVNASVTGYSPWQECDLLETEGLRYQPDVIVYVFCLNDIGQKFRLVKYGGRTKDLAPPEPSVLEWSGLFRMSRALTFRWLGPTRRELEARKTRYAPNAIIDDFEAPHIQEALRVTAKNMDRMVSVAREHEVPIAVVCFPTGRQIDMPEGEWSRPQDWLATFCQKEEVPLLDMTPIYRANARSRGLTGEYLFPDDLHPNKAAHRIAAAATYAFLAERGLLGRQP